MEAAPYDQERLRRIAWCELGRNAGPPSVCYPAIVLVCALGSEYGARHATSTIFFIALTALIGAVRGVAGYRLTTHHNPRLVAVLSAATLAQSMAWTAYVYSAIHYFQFGWPAQLAVIVSVGLSAGGTTTLAPSLWLMRAFILVMLIPPAVALTILQQRESLSAFVVLIYTVFLLSIGRRQHAFYWGALRDNELLRLRTTQLDEARQQAERMSGRNQTILNSAGDGIAGVDNRGCTTFANPAVARMTGISAEQLSGQPVTTWLSTGLVEPSIETCLSDVCQHGVERRVKSAMLRNLDGSTMVVDLIASPVREEGHVVGAVITLSDVTERYAVERLKDQFVSTVSHELRTPLAAIRGALGMLASGQLDDKPTTVHRMLNIANTNSERLVRLIDDLLDLQKMQQGGLSLRKTACDVAQLMTLARDNVAAIAQRADITIASTPLDAFVTADPDRLVQTLINLLSNAIKFSSCGQTVRMTARPIDGAVEFCVADDGCGIAPEMHSRIFDEFFQVDASDSRSRNGTGLGLSICRRIVGDHGGRIWVESEPAHGSRFYFTVPVGKG